MHTLRRTICSVYIATSALQSYRHARSMCSSVLKAEYELTAFSTLEELDGSEAKLMLLDLPPIDVDKVGPLSFSQTHANVNSASARCCESARCLSISQTGRG